MQNIAQGNYVINHFVPSLEDKEFSEQTKLNQLQKILLLRNRKVFTDAILRIGTMIATKRIIAAIALLLLANVCFSQQWTANKKFVKDTTTKTKTQFFQCWGTTQKGQRCKRKVKGAHDFCYQHLNQK